MTTLQEDAKRVRELKLAAEQARHHADGLNTEFKRAQQALFDRMDAEDTTSIRVAGVQYVRKETDYGVVQDIEAFRRWCEINDADEFFEPKARKRLVNELVREYLRDGKPLPDGIGFYTDKYVSQTGG